MKEMSIERKICKVCGEVFSTTSKIQIVHPECRGSYYKDVRKDTYLRRTNGRKNTAGGGTAEAKARKRYCVGVPCEVCGHPVTKIKDLYHEKTKKLHKHNICPNDLADLRMGYAYAEIDGEDKLIWNRLERKQG